MSLTPSAKIAEKRRQKQPKNSHHRASSYPPINITNILPTQSPPATYQMAAGEASTSAPPTRSSSADRLNVRGYLDEAVTEYTEWQQSRVRSNSWKKNFHRAGEIVVEHGLDLDLVYKKDPEFLPAMVLNQAWRNSLCVTLDCG
jgi:hypothetical protein